MKDLNNEIPPLHIRRHANSRNRHARNRTRGRPLHAGAGQGLGEGVVIKKLKALEIILSSPLWPKREHLSASGQKLHDAIIFDAKPYCLLVAGEKYSEAFAMAAAWSPFLNDFIDNTHIQDSQHNVMLLEVYKHYIDACRVDFCQAGSGVINNTGSMGSGVT